jgi:hypothetical protein
MPSGIPGSTFDSEGVCNYCRAYDQAVSKFSSESGQYKQRHLNAILDKYRGKKPFDCIVGLSGGKDSTYLLYLAVKKYGMHPLAFNFDNGYRSPDAVNNIEKTVNELGVDLIVVKPNPKIMHQLQKIFLLRTGEFCTPCLMHIDGIAEQLANRYRIKVMVSGCDESLSTAIDGLSIASYYDRHYYFNTIGNDLPKAAAKKFCKKPLARKAVGRILGIEPVRINLLENINYNILEMDALLGDELNWVPPGGEIEHGDCILDHIKDYLVFQKWGVSEHTHLLSVLVRKGEITRDSALQKAMFEERSSPPHILLKFLRDIDMSPEEFELAKTRHFTQIPNIRGNSYFKLADNAVNHVLRLLKKS